MCLPREGKKRIGMWKGLRERVIECEKVNGTNIVSDCDVNNNKQNSTRIAMSEQTRTLCSNRKQNQKREVEEKKQKNK